jgi:AraC-like DNA-binding protein
VISENYRKTFLEYLNGYRIREAKMLLKEQNEGGEYAHYTVQAIGEMVGFGSRSVFYEAFKQIVGVSPSEYKKVSKELQTKELRAE